jgi:mono/diheme cytochrome c family protein
VWFYAALPVLALLGWWYFQQPPALPSAFRSASTHSTYTRLRRVSMTIGVAVVLIQFVPYGRDHAAIPVKPPAAPIAAAQWCSTNASSMTLGALKQQVGAMQTQLDAALSPMRVGNGGGVAAAYARFTVTYAGVAPALAQLYPLRCPRLLEDRIMADASIVAPRIDGGAATAALVALKSGMASVGTDLDQRIAQASPNGLVANQDQAFADAPFTTGGPVWDSPTTRALATRACTACHSNTPGWAWYTNLAPLSWLVQHNVDAGRAVLNLSEWDMPQSGSALAAARVADGSMPPAWAGWLDSRLALSDAERAALVRGLQSSFQRR